MSSTVRQQIVRAGSKALPAERVRWLGLELVKSPIGSRPEVRKTLEALRLTKMHRKVYRVNNQAVLGMVNRVKHHVEVFDVSDSESKPTVPQRPRQL